VATCDEEKIREWWNEADYNVGVSTTNFVVVDVDMKKGKDGVGSYAMMDGHYDTFVVMTATGGYHCYFTGGPVRGSIGFWEGIDIRSWHNYVVGPGSVVPEGEYRVVCDKPLATVPATIGGALKTPNQRREEVYALSVEFDTPQAITHAIAWVRSAPPAIEGQGGDNQTYQTAAKLVREYALSEETAFKILVDHWNDRCVPPWDLEELYRKVENAQEYAVGGLGVARPEYMLNGVQVIPVPPEPVPVINTKGGFMRPIEISRRPYVVERFAMRGETTMLVSGGGGGKSTILLAAAAHFACGKNFGAYKLTEPGKPLRIVVYNAEEKLEEQSRRLEAICQRFGLDWDMVNANILPITKDTLHASGVDRISLAYFAGGTVVRNQAHIDMVAQMIVDFGADIAILEPLVDMHNVRESDNGDMKQVMRVFEDIALATNAAIVLSHHTVKGGMQQAGQSGAGRGAGAIEYSARINLTLTTATNTDLQRFGIPLVEQRDYVRIDESKMNYTKVATDASLWLRWETLRIQSTDMVGVPVPMEMRDVKDDRTQYMATIIRDYILSQPDGASRITLADAVTAVQAADALFAVISKTTLRDDINRTFLNGVTIRDSEDVIKIHRDNGKGSVLVQLTGR